MHLSCSRSRMTRAASMAQGPSDVAASQRRASDSTVHEGHHPSHRKSRRSSNSSANSSSGSEDGEAERSSPSTSRQREINNTPPTGTKTIARATSAPVVKNAQNGGDEAAVTESTTPPKLPRKLSVAALIRSFSPRAKAKAAGTANASGSGDAPPEAKQTKAPVATFGKLKRSSLSFPASPPDRQQPQKQQSTNQSSKSKLRVEIPPPSLPPVTLPVPNTVTAKSPRSSSSNIDEAFTTGPGSVVDEVRTTLAKLLSAMDTLDPRKLPSIRLGGELRGLLGKAQDEFAAYEEAFQTHVASVGVAIALQNFGAALHQVFAIVERLQHAKLLLLNHNFKREVTFAFQEINSYYTSMFMELSMAVAQASGRPLPLPPPVKVPVEQVHDDKTVEDQGQDKKPPEPSPAALCLEAHAHFFGHGRSVDRCKALDLYKQAAALGSGEAMRCLGSMFWHGGDATPRNTYVAEQWFTRAVSNSEGDLEACFVLGSFLLEQSVHQKTAQFVQDMRARGERQLTMAADRGHAEAQYRLARLLEKRGKEDAALIWYRRAAEQYHSRAQAAVGRILLDAKDGSDSEAVHWLQLSLESGDDADGEALALLGELYSSKGGRGGIVRDVDRALTFLRRAVAAGSRRGMLLLALLLLHRSDKQSSVALQDGGDMHDDALRLLMMAAHYDSDKETDGIDVAVATEALFQIGELLHASPLLRDRSGALRFYVRAAKMKPPHAKAATRAASLLYSGSGVAVAVDKSRAHELYSIAAAAGDAEALNALGLMHEDGDGCELDFREAAACYRRAAAQGHAPAHFNLGCLLAHGKGVARDLVAAQTHFEQALAMGYALAKDFLPPR